MGTTGSALLRGRAVERSMSYPLALSYWLLMMNSTIIHEGTHFPQILGTDDYAYGMSMIRICLALLMVPRRDGVQVPREVESCPGIFEC